MALTKKDLIRWGIKEIKFENNSWVVVKERLHTNGWGTKGEIYNAPIREISTRHKYGDDRTYLGVVIYKGIKPLHRVLYAWFIGDIPDGYDIHHVDDDPFNNSLDNLDLITHADNLRAKRSQNNQWNYIGNNSSPDQAADII